MRVEADCDASGVPRRRRRRRADPGRFGPGGKQHRRDATTELPRHFFGAHPRLLRAALLPRAPGRRPIRSSSARGQAAAARWSRSRTPSHSGLSGGVSTQMSLTPVGSRSRSTANSSLRGPPASSGMRRARCAASGSAAPCATRSRCCAASGPEHVERRPACCLASIRRSLALGRVMRLRACPTRAARPGDSSARAAALAAGGLDLRARQRPGPQQHRVRRGCSRRWSIRCPTSRRRRRAPASASPNSSRTCCAEVGLTRPKRFALGAATPGTPMRSARQRARRARPDGPGSASRWCPGRRPQPRPRRAGACTISGQRPGPESVHQASAPRRDRRARQVRRRRRPRTCTISGWSLGRPFAAKMPATAASLVGIGAEAVDGLGREGDQAAAATAPRGLVRWIGLPSVANQRHRDRQAERAECNVVGARQRCELAPYREMAHLATACVPRFAVQMEPRSRQRAARPAHRGVARRYRPRAKPQIAEQIQHDGGEVLARRDERQTGECAHLQLELRHVASVDRLVPELCGRGAISLTISEPSPARRTQHTARRRSPGLPAIATGGFDCVLGRRVGEPRARAPRSPRGCRRDAGCAAREGARWRRRAARHDHQHSKASGSSFSSTHGTRFSAPGGAQFVARATRSWPLPS